MKLSAVFSVILLTGCALTPKPAPVSIYDLGSIPVTAPGFAQFSPAAIQVADISAPVWLDTEAIRYRLAYHDPARVYTYANSHWTAPPAKLLTEYLRQYLAGHRLNPPGNSKYNRSLTNCLLKINLDEFMQVFDTQNSSHVVIRLRAFLYEPDTHQPIAQHSFTIAQSAQTADAAGAVAAFILASDNLRSELVQWLSGSRQ
ncbi:ABC-type transport auxiliary lipoprotein family protein [Nitrosomonas sp.]|uniref:ABC-type transport auxiliary lipoprotein family protein n=1 Tax=Nitrosomonas sp. TaxID=42353 RepID=UPI0025CEFACA|nr:ABC-type transport auxiliary lipoprotein family protein [Nitrosomonas sp.]MCC6916429.1 membrane integrity-associated transporter subunit PqiC [Nitrosomonas sp.]